MEGKSSRGAGDLFVKTVRKQSLRAKERVLEKLGRADRTQDELFDEYVTNITKQQVSSLKLQKEVKNYAACVKAMDGASKSLNEVLIEVYEPEWVGHPQLQTVSEQLQVTRTEHLKKVNDDLQYNIATYLNQFPEAKNKVAKRNRKLVDFDAARYNLSAILNAPKRNDAKAAKAQDELNAMQRMYESLNDELHRELPAIYDSRIGFYANSLKLLWEAEAAYHRESARVFQGLSETADILAEQGRGNYKYASPIRKFVISAPIPETRNTGGTFSPTSEKEVEIHKTENGHSADVHFRPKPNAPLNENHTETSTTVRNDITEAPGSSVESKTLAVSSNSAFSQVTSTTAAADRNSSVRMYPELPGKLDPITETRVVRTRRPSTPSTDDEANQANAQNVKPSTETIVRDSADQPKTQPSEEFVTPTAEENHSVAELSKATVPSHKILYKVTATNAYAAEDQDELSFESGELITVIPFDNPEEQDEGWLMGVKESDGRRGVFPANFTKLITP